MAVVHVWAVTSKYQPATDTGEMLSKLIPAIKIAEKSIPKLPQYNVNLRALCIDLF